MTSFPIFVVCHSRKTTLTYCSKGDRSVVKVQAARGGRSGSPLQHVQLGCIHRSSHHDRLHRDLNDKNGNSVAGGEDGDNDDGGGGLRNRTNNEDEDGVGVGQYRKGGN